MRLPSIFLFFFFNDTATTEIYTLSLHDALPISLAFYTQFANPAKTSYKLNVKSDFSVDAFTQGKLGMMISYQYMQPLIRAKAPNLNWGVAAIPQLSDQATKINFANYWGEVISKNSKNQ